MDASLLLFRPTVSATSKPKLKRPCSSPLTDVKHIPNPNSLDWLLESFLELPDSSAVSLDLSLDRILQSRPYDSDKDDVIYRAFRLGLALSEAANRSARRRASMHNAVVWALPSDLTIKVFSSLDTQSLCKAAAVCSLFHKCAADPLCYSNVDLTAVVPKVNNMVVSTMIQRAGKELRSLKLGVVPCPVALLGSYPTLGYSTRNFSDASRLLLNDKRSSQGKESFILTRSCLAPLVADGGGPGALLRRLHLFNVERMDNTAFGAALLACSSLLDLKIVGLDDSLKLSTCHDLVTRCPNISTLVLRGFKLQDMKLRVFVKGFRQLKFVDFSTSYSITGEFLRNLGGCTGGNLLDVLILRDCMHLREAEVSRLLLAILGGRFKYLRHLDVSNREGLASDDDWYRRCYSPSFPSLGLLLQERPNLCVLADLPAEGSFVEEPTTSSDNDMNLPSLVGSHTSDGSTYSFSPEPSYNSDQSVVVTRTI